VTAAKPSVPANDHHHHAFHCDRRAGPGNGNSVEAQPARASALRTGAHQSPVQFFITTRAPWRSVIRAAGQHRILGSTGILMEQKELVLEQDQWFLFMEQKEWLSKKYRDSTVLQRMIRG
jgi:hypothetical protein